MPLAPGDVIAARLFSIEVDGVSIAQFRDVEGISSTVRVIEHRENTPDGVQVLRKLPGQSGEADDITLRRGVTADTALAEWHEQVKRGDIAGARHDGAVVLYDYERGEAGRWEFRNGWPRYVGLSPLSVPSDEVVIEVCVITHEGVTRVTG